MSSRLSAFMRGVAKGLLVCTALVGCEVRDNLAVRQEQARDADIHGDAGGPWHELRLRGSAFLDRETLVLTAGVKGERGSAFMPQPFVLSATSTFEVSLRFRIEAKPGMSGPADGIAVVWHNDLRRLQADGRAGGGMGYVGINPAVVVEFDTHKEATTDPDGNHIAVVNGKGEPTALVANVPVDLSGDDVFAWIVHDATRGQLLVYLSKSEQKPAEALLTTSLQLTTTLGAQAYLGLTSATGQRVSRHVVTDFSVMYRP